jgi:diguanylate cyclase (GGDEF)-like protein
MVDRTIQEGLNRLRSEALEAVATGESLLSVAERVCRHAETLAPYAVCSILTVDTKGVIHPLAAPSLPAEYSAALDGIPVGPSTGSCGTAAYRGQPVEVTDIATDPLWADYKGLALAYDLRACWSSPIRSRSGRVTGTFAFYYRTPRGPSDTERLVVATAVHLCAIAIEHAEAQERIERLAYNDTLTGLPNRARFHERVEADLGAGRSVNLFCLDIDDFKGINDSFGHQVGDRLLKDAARRFEEILPPCGFLARLGSDEFGIVLPASDIDPDGERFADRLLNAFQPVFMLEHGPISAGVSVGIARSRCDGDTLQRLVRRADLALQAAKKAGRQTFRLFAPEMEAFLQARRDLTEDLRHAIDGNQFHLAYQPLVSLETGALAGFEALLRWTHPRRGAISPDEFIPLAEETGLIGMLGDWVLTEACREASGWPPGISVSVNLSPVQLRKPGFALDVIRTLGRFDMSPGRLKLEVTETALLADERMSRETLTTLKQLGVEISLDDFGTGYSSLNHLRLMPLHRIKIDRSFIADLDGDNGAAAIVAAVLSLARDLKLETVAEGIETQAQRDWLRAHGCDGGQGYLFGRPEDAATARRLIGMRGAGAGRRHRA